MKSSVITSLVFLAVIGILFDLESCLYQCGWMKSKSGLFYGYTRSVECLTNCLNWYNLSLSQEQQNLEKELEQAINE